MKALNRIHATTIIGGVLVVPFAIVLVNELRVATLVVLTDYNTDDMGSIELAIGGILLAITAPVALGGLALIRRGSAPMPWRKALNTQVRPLPLPR